MNINLANSMLDFTLLSERQCLRYDAATNLASSLKHKQVILRSGSSSSSRSTIVQNGDVGL